MIRGSYIIYFVILFLGIGNLCHGQLYLGKACIANPSDPPPDPGSQGCDERTYFFESSTNPGGNWTWNFGDGTITSNLTRNPNHTYTPTSLPATYTVQAFVIDPSGTTVNSYSGNITVGQYPNQPLFGKTDKRTRADSTICGGKTITLDPYDGSSSPSNVSYKWFPNGETSPTIDVNEAGCYSVEVIDNLTGCSRSATITVKVCFEDAASGGGAEKWYFGHGSGIEFDMTGTEVMPDSLDNDGSLNPQPEIEDPSFNPANPGTNEMKADEAAAMVFTKGGDIALYTDGKKLFSGEDDSEIPDQSTATDFIITQNVGAQGLALVPKPVCSSCDFIKYYLFTVDETTGILSYSVIDMRENSRKGAVTEKNIPVAANISGKLSVDRSGDDLSYLISAFDKSTGNFQSVTIDSLGTITHEDITMAHTEPFISEGYVTVSADGNQLAHGLVINGSNHVEVFTRDPQTNQLSAPNLIDLGIVAPPTIYGLAFSPNGEFLYVTLKGDGSSVNSQLIQVDISSGTHVLIADRREEFGALALGPKYGEGSKYVYLTINNSNTIHYLQSPNDAGATAVGFTLNSSSPGSQVSGVTKLGFPNIVAPKADDEGSGLSMTYSGNCLNAPTFLTAQEICNPMENEMEWLVEGKKYSGKQTPPIYFSRPGWHDISITIKVSEKSTRIAGLTIPGAYCTTVTETGRIYIKPAPELTIPDPLYACFDPPRNNIEFDPKPVGGNSFEFDWMTSLNVTIGDATHRPPTYVFKLAGLYKLRVTNDYTCVTEADINVEEGCEPVIIMPNVITPNGSGPSINESLNVIYYFLEKPKLEIYNRWGDRVFETENLGNEWDGSYKGKVYSNALYSYVLRYYSRDFPLRGEQKHIGTVLVITE